MSPMRWVVALLLVVATGALAGATRTVESTTVPPMQVPLELGTWHGEDAGPVDATLSALGADHVLNRTYAGPDGRAIGLYIASYAKQRPGVSIHSPLHCLPGTGWSLLTDDVLRVERPTGGAGSVRRLIAVRDDVRLLVLYWYAIQDRMVASDALSRFYLLNDSLRLGRNDAALVRLVVPIAGENDSPAEESALSFLRTLAPYVSRRQS
jgi:EpsI family protein